MPNHVTNIIQFNGDEDKIREVLEAIKGEPFEDYDGETKDTKLDFNKITPMPEELNITEGSRGSLGREFLRGSEDAKNKLADLPKEEQDEAIELGQAYIDNKTKYGHETWYSWAVENWGTKWNAYDFDEDTQWNVIQFNTAWSHPFRIIVKLSEMFPDVEIDVKFASEDLGSHVGTYSIKDGDIYEEQYPEDVEDALRLACDIKGYVEEEDYTIDSDGDFRWVD